jgi:hypothetical protein
MEMNIELENGWHVTVDYEYNAAEKAVYYTSNGDPGHPGSSAYAKIYNVWATLTDREGKLVQVDVFKFLLDTDLIDEQELEQEILNKHDYELE